MDHAARVELSYAAAELITGAIILLLCVWASHRQDHKKPRDPWGKKK